MSTEWWNVFEDLAEKMTQEQRKALEQRSPDNPFPYKGDTYWKLYDSLAKMLAEEIEKAFGSMEYPENDSIVSGGRHVEFEKMAESFRGKHWKEIQQDDLYRWQQELSYFTPRAFRFYLPAFLISALSSTPDARTVDEQLVFFNLTPPESDDTEMRIFLEKVEGFTSYQRTTIAAFVKLYLLSSGLPSSLGDKSTHAFWTVE